jgi:hypothetical protein
LLAATIAHVPELARGVAGARHKRLYRGGNHECGAEARGQDAGPRGTCLSGMRLMLMTSPEWPLNTVMGCPRSMSQSAHVLSPDEVSSCRSLMKRQQER